MKNICQKNLVQAWFAPVLAASSAVWCSPCDYFKDGKTQIVAAQIVTTKMVTKLELYLTGKFEVQLHWKGSAPALQQAYKNNLTSRAAFDNFAFFFYILHIRKGAGSLIKFII